jgi:hypothetical protein
VAERVAGNPAVIDPKCDSRAKPTVAQHLKKILSHGFFVRNKSRVCSKINDAPLPYRQSCNQFISVTFAR